MLGSHLLNDTIAAISTAPGAGAIAIVRLSGPQSTTIAAQLFSPSSSLVPLKATSNLFLKTNLARHGFLIDPTSQLVVDEVVVTPYLAPKTYTGEDIVEISCHGGPLMPRQILALCLTQGARLAQPGEFTQRAYLNGCLDLTQAEAVLDLIQAKTGRQGQSAISALTGQLGEKIKQTRSELIALLTEITAGLDFPEEIGDTPSNQIAPLIQVSKRELEALAKTARSGKFMRDGLSLSIVGRPNAGKSSLLNQLLKYERAIVSETPGTTRDSLEEMLDINGIPVILIDTAGIRTTNDSIEKIGIERTISAIQRSDLVLVLVDLTCGFGEIEQQILALVGSKPYLLIGNKCDLCPDRISLAPELPQPEAVITISAKTGTNLDEIGQVIEQWVFAGAVGFEKQASLNVRQGALCIKALQSLQHVEETLMDALPQDCLAADLKIAIDSLSEMCGESVSEEIIHQVFANFCIGK